MNNNRIEKNGSLMLMVLLLMTTLVFLVHAALRTTSYFVSLAQEREKYEKQYQLIRSLETFGLTHYADAIKKSSSDSILFKEPWPHEQSNYEGIIRLEQRDHSHKILHTSLIHKDNVLISFSRLIDHQTK